MSQPGWQESTAFCDQIVKACKRLDGVYTFIQVGCCDGFEGRYVRARDPNCIGLVGFEPNQDVKPEAQDFDFRRLAISNFCGKATLSMADAIGMSSLMDRGGATCEVDVMSLDHFMASARVDPCSYVLMIDTEGTLLDVLAGAAETLQKTMLVVAEVTNDQRSEAESILAGHGLHFVDGYGYSAGSQANWFYARGWTPQGEG